MAQYAVGAQGWTPVNHADGASALANNSYQGLRTTTAANTIRLIEVFVGGEAVASTVNRMAYRRVSTQVATPTAVTPGGLNPASQASLAAGYVAATTGPTIASTAHLLDIAFNTFGGVVRWVAAPGEEIYQLGTAGPNTEGVFDSIAGLGVVSSNIKFEEL